MITLLDFVFPDAICPDLQTKDIMHAHFQTKHRTTTLFQYWHLSANYVQGNVISCKI